VVVADGDGGFQVDDARGRTAAFQFGQGIAPHIAEVHRARQRAAGGLGQLQVGRGVADIGFVQLRVAGVGQDLIDAPAGHHVAAQKQCERGHG
jgi:hypothetical protein